MNGADTVDGVVGEFGVPPEQEPKYGVNIAGRFFNRSTGVEIPADEPVFLLRAKDVHAVATLQYYQSICESPDHKAVVGQRMSDFAMFRAAHPERMREPTSNMRELAAVDFGAREERPGS